MHSLRGWTRKSEFYVRPPKEGIPGVPAGALVALVKGVFGLQESPRLWWLKMGEAFLEASFVALRFAVAVFVLRNGDGSLGGIVAVRGDDGMWAGKGAKYERARSRLRKLINSKTEKSGEFKVFWSPGGPEGRRDLRGPV